MVTLKTRIKKKKKIQYWRSVNNMANFQIHKYNEMLLKGMGLETKGFYSPKT